MGLVWIDWLGPETHEVGPGLCPGPINDFFPKKINKYLNS